MALHVSYNIQNGLKRCCGDLIGLVLGTMIGAASYMDGYIIVSQLLKTGELAHLRQEHEVQYSFP